MKLLLYLEQKNLEHVPVLNWLQDRGIISDNVIVISDIPEAQHAQIIETLEKEYQP